MCNTIKYQSSQLSELWTETKLLQAASEGGLVTSNPAKIVGHGPLSYGVSNPEMSRFFGSTGGVNAVLLLESREVGLEFRVHAHRRPWALQPKSRAPKSRGLDHRLGYSIEIL